jgi:TonB-dependent SusC/RagA subfamily outer membrane receptor
MIPWRLAAVGLLLALEAGCARRQAGEDAPAPAQPPPGGQVVTGEEIVRTPGQPIEVILMNRFPGVVVTRASDGSLAIRIRGMTSIYGNNLPLYVIDGVPIEAGPGGALFGINPYDIDTIEILKDAAATAMYGVRGANGVIIVKTKQAG